MSVIHFPQFSREEVSPFEMRQLVQALELRFQTLEQAERTTSSPFDEFAEVGHTHVSSDITDLDIPTSIFDLTDVLNSISDGQGLIWDSVQSAFVPGSVGGGGVTTLNSLSNVSVPAPADGEVLSFNSSSGLWEAEPLSAFNTLANLTDTDLTGQAQYDLLFNAGGAEWRDTAGQLQWNNTFGYLLLDNDLSINWKNDVDTPIEMLTLDSANLFIVGDPTYDTRIDGGTTTVTGDLNVDGAATLDTTLGVTGNTTLSGTLEVTGVADFNDNVDLNGVTLTIFDGTGADSLAQSHDGTDYNWTFTGTTDWAITGITSIQAGTVDVDFDAITATSYGGILEANLLDRTVAESITGVYDFTNGITAASYDGILAANLLDKTAAESISGDYTFEADTGNTAITLQKTIALSQAGIQWNNEAGTSKWNLSTVGDTDDDLFIGRFNDSGVFQDVTLRIDSITGDVTLANSLTVTEDLTVSGTLTSINTTDVNIADNQIVLNSDVTGTPTENAGFIIERGTSTNVDVRWNETTDTWQFTNDGATYFDMITALGDVSDVNLTTPADAAFLIFEQTAGEWRDFVISGDVNIDDGGVASLTPTTLAGYGISDTKASFDTALSDADFVFTDTAFSGDVTGAYNATVVGDDTHNHTNATITLASDDLTDVAVVTPADRHVLVYDGVTDNQFENRLLVEADISDLKSYLLDITGESIGSLSDVDITTPGDGAFLIYDTGTATWRDFQLSGDVTVDDSGVAVVADDSHAHTNSTITLAVNDLTDVANAAPADRHVLVYDGVTDNQYENRLLVEADISDLGTYLENLSEDASPQLGANLDVQTFEINTSTVDGSITISPNGTGNVVLGNYTLDGDQTVGAGQDNYVLTYDNSTGLISLEASAGGGGSGTIVDGTVDDTIPRWDTTGGQWEEETQLRVSETGVFSIYDGALTSLLSLSHDGTEAVYDAADDRHWFDGRVSVDREANSNSYFSVGPRDATLRGDSQDGIIYLTGEQTSVVYGAQIDVTGNFLRIGGSVFGGATEVASIYLQEATEVRGGRAFRIRDTGNTDYVEFSHDGLDFNIAGTNTTDINLTGITSLQAGTVDADFDAITATSYGGITEANLLDKSATETVTGAWTFDGNIAVTGNVDGRDVSVDGTKLDGIESGAKDDQTITAGVGLSGGGTGDVSLALDFGELGVGGTLLGTDYLIAENGGVENRQLISSIPLSIFNNDSGWTSNAGTITGTVANDQVAVGTGASSLDSSSDLTYDGTRLFTPELRLGRGSATVDNDILLDFNIDRPWRFIQDGNDAAASLALQSFNDAKQFQIQTSAGVSIFSFLSSTTAPWFRIYDAAGTDYMQFQHDGTDFNFDGTNTTDINITGVTAIQAGTVDADFDVLTSTSLTATGTVQGGLITTDGTGRVALTVNDGAGNANVTFNHANGSADSAGNVGRIEVNVDATTGAYMGFHITSNAAAGAVTAIEYMNLTESGLTVTGDISATSFGSILEANLLDRTGADTITGLWAFEEDVIVRKSSSSDQGSIFWQNELGTTKWQWGTSGATDDDLFLGRYNESGVFQDSAIFVDSPTGNITIPNELELSGTGTANGLSLPDSGYIKMGNSDDALMYWSSGATGILFDIAGSYFLRVNSNEAALSAISNGAVLLYHNAVQTTRTATKANGGLEVDQDVSGSGYERVLTESDGKRFYQKTADETVTGSTTLQIDNHIASIPLVAGEWYVVEMHLTPTATSSGNLKIQFQFDNTPADAHLGIVKHTTYITPSTTMNYVAAAYTAIFTGITVSSAAGNIVHFKGSFRANATTGGNMALWWAQNSSSGSTTLKTGDWMSIQKISP